MTFFSEGYDEVVIKWCSATTLTAAVRDGAGVFDCTFSADGWSCSCGGDPCDPCAHTLAVRTVAMVAT